ALARLVRLLLPAVFGLAAVQVMVFVNTLLASLLRPGSISYLYYADRVMEFPLGVFGIALASASLPVMARPAAAGEARGLTGIVAVGANVLAALLMMGPLGHAGLAGASSVGAYVNLLALLYVARRRLGPLGGRALAASAARTLAASIPLIGWCALVLALWPASRSLPVNIVWLGG